MISLNLSGQFRLQPGQTITQKVDHFRSYLNPDLTVLYVWEDEFITHQKELESLRDCLVVCAKIPEFPKDQLNRICQVATPANSLAVPYFYQMIGIQEVFKHACQAGAQIQIRCRYDNYLATKFNWKLARFLLQNSPSMIVPMGADYHFGLGDIFYVMDRKTSELMTNYLEGVLSLCDSGTPFHPEMMFRAFLYQKSDIFRISYPVRYRHGNVSYFKEEFLGPYYFKDTRAPPTVEQSEIRDPRFWQHLTP